MCVTDVHRPLRWRVPDFSSRCVSFYTVRPSPEDWSVVWSVETYAPTPGSVGEDCVGPGSSLPGRPSSRS